MICASNRSSFPSVEQPVQNDKEVLVSVVLRGLQLNIYIIHSLSVKTCDCGIHENVRKYLQASLLCS